MDDIWVHELNVWEGKFRIHHEMFLVEEMALFWGVRLCVIGEERELNRRFTVESFHLTGGCFDGSGRANGEGKTKMCPECWAKNTKVEPWATKLLEKHRAQFRAVDDFLTEREESKE